MPAAAEIQAATLQNFIKGWSDWTVDGFLASWSDDCIQITLPLGSEAKIRTRKDVEVLFPKLMSILTNFQVSGHIKLLVFAKRMKISNEMRVSNLRNESSLQSIMSSTTLLIAKRLSTHLQRRTRRSGHTVTSMLVLYGLMRAGRR